MTNQVINNTKSLSMQPVRDVCHYSCSKLNKTNMLLAVVIILLCVLLFKKSKK